MTRRFYPTYDHLHAGAAQIAAQLGVDRPTPPTRTPGSYAATQAGCTCPPIANHFGRGASETTGGARVFDITPGCPLHDAPDAPPPRAA